MTKFTYEIPPVVRSPEREAELRRAKDAFQRWKADTGGWSYSEFLTWWKTRDHLSVIEGGKNKI